MCVSGVKGKGLKGRKVGVESQGTGEGYRGRDVREMRERVRKKEAGVSRKQVVETKFEVSTRRERRERERERRYRRQGEAGREGGQWRHRARGSGSEENTSR